jgi:hypothetical protein
MTGDRNGLAALLVVAAAMIDRLVHHAEVISLKGDSYRLKDRNLGRVPAAPRRDRFRWVSTVVCIA